MKTLNFSGSYVACDLKVSRYNMELMKFCVQSQDHFLTLASLTLAKGHIYIKFKT